MGKVFLFIFFPKFVASFTLFQPINMQTRTLYLLILLILFLCCPTLLMADEWDENLYRQIEASISLPTIGQSEETVSRYGASETASAAKNQRAIQRAIDHCTKRGGGKVVVPAGQRLRTGGSTATTSPLAFMLSRLKILPSPAKEPLTVVVTRKHGGHGVVLHNMDGKKA